MVKRMMKKTLLEQIAVFGFLIVLGIVGRLWSEIPNFAPVAAISLFSGFYFRSPGVAIAVPVSIMLVSDMFIGGYEPLMMISVYSLLALPVLFRHGLRRGITPVNVVGYSFASSVVFFLGTNFVVWAYWYPMTLESFVACYVNAFPFFRYTVMGDLIFATSLFGGFAFLSIPKGVKTQPSLEA